MFASLTEIFVLGQRKIYFGAFFWCNEIITQTVQKLITHGNQVKAIFSGKIELISIRKWAQMLLLAGKIICNI